MISSYQGEGGGGGIGGSEEVSVNSIRGKQTVKFGVNITESGYGVWVSKAVEVLALVG